MTGSSKKETTTTSNAPWAGAQPALNLALYRAQEMYNNNEGGKIFRDSTVVPWDQKTQQGMNAITDSANANVGGNGLSGQYQRTINSGGFTDPQLAALDNTKRTANSSFDINSNPAFMQVLQQAQDAAKNSVNSSASGAGRYGSGVHQQTLGNTVGDVTSRAVAQEYNNWQNRRDTANNNLFNMGQTAFNNIGDAYSGLQAPAQSLMQVGSMNEDLATRQLNDRLRVFNEENNRGWDQLGRLNAIASGAGSLGSTQTTAAPGQNPFLTALGYGAGAGGLLGAFL